MAEDYLGTYNAPKTATNTTPQVPVGQIGNTKELTLPTSGQFRDTTSTSVISEMDAFLAQPQQEDTSQMEMTDQQLKSLLGESFNTLASRGEFTSQLEEQKGIGTLTEELDDINNQIRGKTLAFRREQEALAKEAGLTAAQKNARMRDIERKQASELADLSIIQQARQDRLSSAQSWVDRKVQLKFADEQTRLDGLKFFYQENKDVLTKAQDRKYQQMITRENRAFELAKGRYQQLENQKLELVKNARINGASNSVMQAILSAQNLGDAFKAAGSYGISIEDRIKQAQLQKARAELGTTGSLNEKTENLVTLAQLISDLTSGKGKSGAVGFGGQKLIPGFLKGGKTFVAGSKAAGYETSFNQLKDSLAMENIGKLKGAMSDKDLEFLRNTATRLSLGMPEEEFDKELANIRNRVYGKLETYGVDTTQFALETMDNDTFLSKSFNAQPTAEFFKVK